MTEKYVIPKLEFMNGVGSITTHIGNTYKIQKISDAAYITASNAGTAANKPELTMISIVAASLIEPKLTKQEVSEKLFDGELFLLSTVISNYYNEYISFLQTSNPNETSQK